MVNCTFFHRARINTEYSTMNCIHPMSGSFGCGSYFSKMLNHRTYSVFKHIRICSCWRFK